MTKPLRQNENYESEMEQYVEFLESTIYVMNNQLKNATVTINEIIRGMKP